MGKQGIHVYSRPLRYQRKEVFFRGGGSVEAEFPVEKGVDVRIAIDVIRLCLQGCYDVALIFSQDQDLSEVADEIRAIASERDQWMKVASAYPVSDKRPDHAHRGINKTDWIALDQQFYDSCIDHRDYRAGKKRT